MGQIETREISLEELLESGEDRYFYYTDDNAIVDLAIGNDFEEEDKYTKQEAREQGRLVRQDHTDGYCYLMNNSTCIY